MKEGKIAEKCGKKAEMTENKHEECCNKHEESKEQLKIKELTDMLQRLQAEFENYRKRKEREAFHIKACSNQDLILKLLNILDNFELALQSKDDKGLRKGVDMIYAQMLSTFENEGLSVILDNKTFNPELHEAIICEKSDCKDGEILEVLQKGYKLNGIIIRHSKVKVAKNGN
jgi:molecular chaperone GrpE